MRKHLLLAVALAANLGLARAAEPSAPAQPAPKAAAGAEAHDGKAKPAEDRAKPTPAPAKQKKDAKPPEQGGAAAGKPDEKPCEPVKPCPIDG
jgi:hypothetical protein